MAKLDPKDTLNIIKDTAKEKNKKNLPRRVNNLQFNPSIKEGIDDEELTFHHSIDTSGRHQYDIYSNNKNNGYGGHVAGATLRKDKPVISSVMVRPEYRRQGVATKLYNHIEKEHNIKLRPNDALTDDGKKFWAGRKESLKESNDLDNKVSETHKTDVGEYLKSKPTLDKDKNWLHHSQISEYSDNEDEVHLKHLADRGVHLATRENMPMMRLQHKGKGSYEKTELRMVPLDKIYYSQPSVNKGKLEHFATHYHPKAEDFHTATEQKKYEAPHVSAYPDGTYWSGDHHRLIASKLRGDTHAIARVTTYAEGPAGWGGPTVKQVKTKKDKTLK